MHKITDDSYQILLPELPSLTRAAQLTAHDQIRELAASEAEDLQAWLQADPRHLDWWAQLTQAQRLSALYNRYTLLREDAVKEFALFEQAYLQEHLPTPSMPLRPVRHRAARWLAYAAILMLIVGAVVYQYIIRSTPANDLATQHKNTTEIAPGGARALLTLADGRRIALDSAADGRLATQGGIPIMKLAGGQITYDVSGMTAKAALLNTMSTPTGGQYQITLSDGTKAWLNAASSITYPVAFTGGKRQVKVTGEVYFEVARNKQIPFIVDADGESLVEVLGTTFNINCYKDDGKIKTTLVEGSVKVSQGNKYAVLQPGQQATIDLTSYNGRPSAGAAAITMKSNIDLVPVLAWKNGIFDFTGADLKTVMRQLERWYDVKVQYKGSMSEMVFEGRMYRNVNLSYVLQMFKKMGVKFELDGKNLIIY